MRATLWGPAVWRIMFASTWRLAPENVEHARRLLLDLIPELLPCPTCQEHYRGALTRVHRRAGGKPRDGDHAFRWCWYMKDEVNQRLRRPSIHLADLVDRYLLHGNVVAEVEVADVLVLMALSSRATNRDDAFVEFCAHLALLLPLPSDSTLRHYLAHVARPVVPTALRLARHTREAHGLPRVNLEQYQVSAAA